MHQSQITAAICVIHPIGSLWLLQRQRDTTYMCDQNGLWLSRNHTVGSTHTALLMAPSLLWCPYSNLILTMVTCWKLSIFSTTSFFSFIICFYSLHKMICEYRSYLTVPDHVKPTPFTGFTLLRIALVIPVHVITQSLSQLLTTSYFLLNSWLFQIMKINLFHSFSPKKNCWASWLFQIMKMNSISSTLLFYKELDRYYNAHFLYIYSVNFSFSFSTFFHFSN